MAWRRFLGTFGSTFSSYISRVRAYHSAALVPDKGVYFTNYPETQARCSLYSALHLMLAPSMRLNKMLPLGQPFPSNVA